MKRGDNIVCIDAAKVATTTLETGLEVGKVYTVRWAGQYVHYIDGNFYGVRLEEIDRGADPAEYDKGDMPFRASRFRPAVSPLVKKELEEVV